MSIFKIKNTTEKKTTPCHATYILDDNGFIINFNFGATVINKCNAQWIAGHHFSVFYGSDQCKAGIPQRNLSIARELSICIDHGIRIRPDGSSYQASVFIETLYDVNGNICGYIKSVNEIEQEDNCSRFITQPVNELSPKKSLIKKAMYDLLQIIFIIELKTKKIVYANKIAGDFCKTTPQEMEGDLLNTVLPVEFSNHLQNIAFEAGSSGEPKWGLCRILKEGKPRFYHTCAQLLSTQSQQGTIILSAMDFTKDMEDLGRFKYLALHDNLTGLANRYAFMKALETSISQNEPVALIAIDLDYFKRINDTLGHAAGDMFLQKVASRLQPELRRTDLLARIGGDEFLVLLRLTDTEKEAASIVKRLMKTLNTPVTIGTRLVESGASMGVVLSKDNSMPEALLAAADAALYESKSRGRNKFCFYTRKISEREERCQVIESGLRSSLKNNDKALFIYYQPIIEVSTGKILGREALLRWVHPELGAVLPGEFIPIAEKSEIIHSIGSFVLHKSCLDAALWNNNETVAINISTSQLRNSALPDEVKKALATSGLKPARLELEISETAVAGNNNENYEMIQELNKIGVKVVIHDFAAKYSILRSLQNHQFTKIKIDRFLINNLGSVPEYEVTVKAIILLCKELGISVVATGVETNQQRQWLENEGCTLLQGWLISKDNNK